MNTKENLDNYNKAYNKDFIYNDENSWLLSRYAQYMSRSIKDNNFKNIMSLGIGHNIVSDILSSELDDGIENYIILEGSKYLINKFNILPNYKNRLELIHTFFEDFETSQKFDIIEMGFVLEHVDDPKFIVEKYKNYLSAKGRMFIAVPNARSLHRVIGYESGLLENIYGLSEYDYQLGHKRFFDLDSISDIIINAGLKIENKMGLFLKPITTSQMKQLGWTENIITALLKIGESNPEISNCILIEAKL